MRIRHFAYGAAMGVGFLFLACFAAGQALSYPAMASIGAPPSDLAASSVLLRTDSNHLVAGWFSRGLQPGAVLLLHGVRSNRTAMLARARTLHREGYSVLLIDLPAHGESAGERITFGLREAEGVRAALAYLRREMAGQPIGVIGVSLGAASVVLAKSSPPPDAIVLESMYPTIEEALNDRVAQRLGIASHALSPLLLLQLPFQLGISADQLHPIDELRSLHAPVLIASGTMDQHTTIAESRRIFEAAASPKEFWAVEGAAHVDLYAYAPRAYEAKVLPFLAKYLRRGD